MFNDPQVERMALFHIFAGDDYLLKQFEPEDFFDDTNRSVFLAAKTAKESDGQVEISPVDHLLRKVKGYAGLVWLCDVIAPQYTADPRTTVKILRELRARRDAKSFKASENPETIPEEFMQKGREIHSLLHVDTNPMETLVEEIKNRPPLTETGFPQMDALLGGGIEDGSLFIIAARPGLGKTTLALNIASYLLGSGNEVTYVTMEMARHKIVTRLLQHFWKESKARVREHAQDMIDLPAEFHVNDEISELNNILSFLSAKLDSKVFIIDHMHLMRDKNSKNDLSKLENISRSMKLFAMENKKPVILLCQLNRQIENSPGNREPELADLRGSGSIEQDADVVTFLWNPNAKDDNSMAAKVANKLEGKKKEKVVDNSKIHWIVRKNRDGRCGSVILNFKPDTFSFSEL